jgi:hypothetical protein
VSTAVDFLIYYDLMISHGPLNATVNRETQQSGVT